MNSTPLIFVIAALGLVVGFIVGSAWQTVPAQLEPPDTRTPAEPKPTGYDSKGRLLFDRETRPVGAEGDRA